ncbi:MAG: glutathione S-transferase [Polyangiaceae bacterium]
MPPATAELLGLPYSPWSEKARWALDVRHVPYVSRTYAPLLGEPALRFRLKRWRGPVTVPVLRTDDGTMLADSLDIARWADGRGEGPALFPRGRESEVLDWVARSERGLDAGRSLSLHRMLDDDDALREMVPKSLRGTLGPVGVAVGRAGVARTLRKYGGRAEDRARHLETFVAGLEALRSALATPPNEGGVATLLGTFTFADVAMAQVLAFVAPPAFGLRIGHASRRAFTDDVLRERFADLLAWRDALYEAHRPKPTPRPGRG